AIDIDFRDIDRQKLRNLDVGLFQLRLGNFENLFQELGKLRSFQANVHRARKIEEAFDYLIEAVNFLVQNLHGLPRGAVAIVKPVEGQGFFEEIGKHTSELQSPDHLVCRLLLE